MKVAVDAMGGDHAPAAPVRGALQAARELGIDVILVGEEAALRRELGRGASSDRVSICHCSELVGMDEVPLKAVRQKRDSSIRVAFDLVRRGEADAAVSAGNSGATLAAGVITLGRMEGVERPAIAGLFPAKDGPVILIDIGANVDCRPHHLLQFGIMAHAFAVSCLGIADPKTGLLSIGEEAGKGNDQVRQASELFKHSQLNFTGNVEGRDIFSGRTQIIVCDGFVGNVALKVTEGVAEVMSRLLRRELASTIIGKATAMLGRGCFERVRKRLDYEEVGGAPLLGISGVGIVCHGGSSPRCIRNAIGLAVRYVQNRVLERMRLQLGSWWQQPAVASEGIGRKGQWVTMQQI